MTWLQNAIQSTALGLLTFLIGDTAWGILRTLFKVTALSLLGTSWWELPSHQHYPGVRHIQALIMHEVHILVMHLSAI